MMNSVDVVANGVEFPCKPEKIKDFCLLIMDRLEINGWEFTLLFCSDDFIQNLNLKYRNKDEATDILTFCEGDSEWKLDSSPEQELYYAGDIVVSVDSLKQNAEYFNVTEVEELKNLLIHGILHLMGMEHKTNSEDEEMLIFQKSLLKECGDFNFEEKGFLE